MVARSKKIRLVKACVFIILFFLLSSFALPVSTFCQTISSVSASTSFQWFPAICGTRIVWVDNRAGNLDIYMYDISTGQEIPICTNPADQYMPKIYGDRVVWMDKRAMVTKEEKWDIYMYDLASGQEVPICTSPGSHKSPSIWKDYIVWQDERNGNADIYLYNLKTQEERPITLASGNQMYPSIDGDRIVWLDGRENFNFTDIYMYDLTLEKEIPIWVHNPNRPEAAGVPAIFADKIVWDINHEDGSASLYLYRIPTGHTSVLVRESGSPTNRTSIYHVAIWGNLVAYTLCKDGIRQVKIFNLETGEILTPSTSLTGQDAPALWENYLAWQEKASIFEEIFWTKLPSGEKQQKEFYDLEDHWSKPWIDTLLQAGLVNGFDDGTIRPDSFLTRAQFATLLAAAFPSKEGDALSFADVPIDSWYFSSVQKVSQAGWMIGFPDGCFRPEEPVSKAQAIAALVRAASLEVKDQDPPFEDAVGHWASTYVSTFFLEEPPLLESRFYPYIALGGKILPDFPITRGQAFLFLASTLRLPPLFGN